MILFFQVMLMVVNGEFHL